MAKRKATKAQNPTAYPRTRWDVFIDLLREWGVISKAAEGAKVNRRTAYERRAGNAEFARQWDDALQDFADSLEAEAIRRARDGIIKGVYHQGVLMNSEVQYSDTLMAQLLKAEMIAARATAQAVLLKDRHGRRCECGGEDPLGITSAIP